MKTKNLLLIGCLFFGLTLFAENVPVEKARKVALNFYFEKHNQFEGSIDFEMMRITDTYTKKQVAENYYYVFSFNIGGYVIVPADNCLPPVLAYSFNHEFVTENQPPNIQYWLGQYKNQVIFAREEKMTPTEARLAEWKYYAANESQLLINERDDGVEPLLTTLWDQGQPYNCMCPEGEGGQTITGCVATAYAQCLYYWKFPIHGSGYHCYEHPVYGELCADFENTYYRWDEMCDEPRTKNTAIGELMYNVGVAVEMNYGVNGSGAMGYPEQIEPWFNISTDFDSIQQDLYSNSEWRAMILEQLDKKYVVLYIGFSLSSGHAWVCDGYQDTTYFHMNWGWGGSDNGYYTLDNLQGYNSQNYIGINFYPDTLNFEYPFYASGADTLDALEGSITDGSGPVNNYLNNTQASWLIDPQSDMDSVTNITLKVKNCDIGEGDYLKFYDGADNTATLLAEITGNTFPETIESSGNRVFVEFTSNEENNAPGFYLNYSTNIPVLCSSQDMINDSIKHISDGSGRFPYRNNTICMWLLQPEGCDSSLTLYFDYFDTEADYDYLQIFDLETQEVLAEYSGYFEEPPAPVVSTSGSMMLRFCTNKNTRGKGWSAHYGDFTGIENQLAPIDFLFSPNPAQNTIHISLQSMKPETAIISIYNQLGQKMEGEIPFKTTVGNNELSLDISSFKNGVYFLQISVDGEMVTKKFIKY